MVDGNSALSAPNVAKSRIGIVVGTRPEVIKLAPIVAAMGASPVLEPVVIGTSQHSSLLQGALDDMALTVDHAVAPIVGAATLCSLAAWILSGLSRLLPTLDLDALMVHGDTTTSVVAAMAAFYSGLPLVHVEAGLRSGDRRAPFPEEVNRRMTTVMADLHLAPTTAARDRLVAEGVDPATVVVTGNTVVDAVMARTATVPFDDPRVAEVVGNSRRTVVLTTHRRESWGDPMDRVAAAVARIAQRHPDVDIVVPMHPNPIVRHTLLRLAGYRNVVLTEPLPYPQFLQVLSQATVVLTDSGGVQEEAPSFGVPVLVLRDTTERQEGLDGGHAVLVGTSEERIVTELELILAAGTPAVSSGANPYGDGRAAERSIAAVATRFGPRSAADERSDSDPDTGHSRRRRYGLMVRRRQVDRGRSAV